MRIAALLTCFNRREKTVACIEALGQQRLPDDAELRVFLVDDGSTDGTSEEVERRFPYTQVIRGDGSLYWNGGMHRAFEEAMKDGFDYYVWVNDDSMLVPSALETLLRTSRQVEPEGPAIIVGTLCDPETNELTYGGLVRGKSWPRVKWSYAPLSEAPQACDTMNGNCVLIPAAIAQAMGNLSVCYLHGLGDFDYGFRVRKAGFPIWTAPGCVGFCSRNSVAGTWQDGSLTFAERWKKLNGPKGLPPKSWLIYCWRHSGILWPAMFLSPFVKVLAGRGNRSSTT